MTNLFDNYKLPEKKRGSQRADLIQQFVDQINKDRIGTKFKPVTGKGIAMKLSHVKDIGDLYYFYSVCKQYKGGFSKCFFGSLKIK